MRSRAARAAALLLFGLVHGNLQAAESSATVADDPQQLAIGDPARASRQAPVVLDAVTDTASGELITAPEMARRLADVRVLFIGEQHTDANFHEVQLRTIQALHAAGRKVIIGLEMFPWTQPPALAAWTKGRLTEQQFLDRSDWYGTWSHHWGYYRDIFYFARDQRLPLVGVNAPREVVRTVRAKGLDALDPASRAHMPPSIDIANDEHRRLFRAYFDPDDQLHSKMPPEQLESLYQAQVTWDAAMGWNAGQSLPVPDDPRAIVVVLIGSGHVAYGLGAERQLRPHFKGRIASLIPVMVKDGKGAAVSKVSAAYANFIWGVPYSDGPSLPVLGVSLMGAIGKEPGKVIQVSQGSVAARAGIQVGDILRSLDGVAITSTGVLQKQTGQYRWGDVAQLTLERNGASQMLPVPFRRSN
jgi:uncharacterized iron-regulated protein